MAITKSNPPGSRATRLTLSSVASVALNTQWDFFHSLNGSFTAVTTELASTSGNVLDSGLSFIDIWLH